jgi:predicted metal-binding protein
MAKKFIDAAASVMYEMGEDLFNEGFIDSAAMREFEEVCVVADSCEVSSPTFPQPELVRA